MARLEWNHTPDLPLKVNPLFEAPFRPKDVVRWYLGAWLPFSVNLAIVGLAVLSYLFFSPSLAQATGLGWWMLEVLLRNGVVILCLAGGLHQVFHGAKLQGLGQKYDPRPYPRTGRMFTFDKQIWDNMFWTMCSGVPIWSAFECLLWMGLANGWVSLTSFTQNPIWFLMVFPLIPIWESFYFYWIHRILHLPLFYKFHALHHRNTDVGPWSGLSMHPVEHVMYFGTGLIHFVVPTHPVHMITHLMFYALYAVTTHTGFEGVWRTGRKRLHLGNFHHQMHHRYFECNYGTLEVPWDKFFGTFHDGTDAAKAQMKARLQEHKRA
ncbi:MAG: sterol desaturase family protein [Aliishimia sp.]